MSEENKALVRRMFEEAYNANNLAIVDEVIAKDYVGYYPDSQKKRGPEEVRQHFARDHAGWPDALITIDDQVAEGDKVVTRWTWGGTHTGHWFKVVPTGKYSTCPGVTISRIAGGKIVEAWWIWDNLGFLGQLGLASTLIPQ